MVSKDEIQNALYERHTKELQDKISAARVAIAGLGGLGSNIAAMLARLGVGHMLLVDFDRVDITNLNRQNYFIRHIGMKKTEATKEVLSQINPYIDIEIKNVKVNADNAAELFKGYPIVCEAFDKAENKAMLINTLLFSCKEMKIVSGSGMAGYSSANDIKTKKRMKNLYVCGDGICDINEKGSLMPPRVLICAGHQANAVLRLILGEEV